MIFLILNSKEIRNSFLDFFKAREHRIVPSSPVVPFNDPTLLFTNAGMNQFKDVFLGTGTRDYSRAADTQKCIRAGGKHNDLEEVGMDGYHHTFFEMLGNWSFGDYYKKEAIVWAWTLLTEVWKLPKEKLWASVFETDDEAFDIWRNETDINPEHILRFGEKDNFWEMGETGPCGPCSEIHFDFSESGCKPEDVNSGNENVIEIWNLVFIQYNRMKDRELVPLPKKHVDTGMGFERMVRVLQNKKSNYETDIFLPLIEKISLITSKEYSGENISSINAIADHIRALTFAITDGAIPSNEGRGYVLRRILRRASRLARKLEYHKPILCKLVDTVVENLNDVFPELNEKKDFAKEVIKAEEESFNVTLDRGIKLFNEVADSLKDTKIFPGEDAFKLYDTFGFPIDLTEVMARELGLNVEMLKFNEEMEKQKERARSARKDTDIQVQHEIVMTGMIDYNPYLVNSDNFEIESTELKTYINQSSEGKSNSFSILLSKIPFYIESGGQISDSGSIVYADNFEAKIESINGSGLINVRSDENLIERNQKFGNKVIARVDIEKRLAIQRNHSATHLVHEALKRILGSHVKQLGSLVHNEYLRFDFPHFHKVEDNQLKDIEALVNSKIRERIEVYTDVDIPLEEANKIPNVKKFFGEKYGDKVRVVHIDDNFSIEFCGGTHVGNTSDIGLFKIVKEESIASGTRRIFARTGEGILEYMNERISDIEKILSELPAAYSSDFTAALNAFSFEKANADFRDSLLMQKLLKHQNETIASLYEAREVFIEEKRQMERRMLKENLSRVFEEIDKLILSAKKFDSFYIISGKVNLNSADEFKEIGDDLRKKVNNGVALIASVIDGKINLVCSVSDNLIREKNLNAGKIISQIAKQLGGGGGGKPHLATAGGKDIAKLDDVLSSFRDQIADLI